MPAFFILSSEMHASQSLIGHCPDGSSHLITLCPEPVVHALEALAQVCDDARSLLSMLLKLWLNSVMMPGACGPCSCSTP
jgi:hypothetical protein